ncbi:MAG TPA: cell division protein FtsZ [Flavipsychrobacter sp.]|nr:cell division protein FtsZ [Flavipsychrobacter sp.]
MIHFEIPKNQSSIIKVIGVGGGGGNAVNYMYNLGIEGVDFVVCNTDQQALTLSPIPNKIQLGPHLTQGLGAGANPEIGKQASEESLEDLTKILKVNTRMAFITAGMGGGTGTGGAPVLAKICRDLDILTVGIVTMPFTYEGKKRMKQAQEGIDRLREHVDTILIISNDKLRQQFGNLPFTQAFAKADDILATAAKCITDVINTTGQINVDFADVCTVMKNGGVAILGSAAVAGENRALHAVEQAINSPLLNDNDIRGAKWILLNINSAPGALEHTMDEAEEIQAYVQQQAGENCDVILGMGHDPALEDKISVTVIATGFTHKDLPVDVPMKKAEPNKILVSLSSGTPPASTPAPVEKTEAPAVTGSLEPRLVDASVTGAPAIDPKPAFPVWNTDSNNKPEETTEKIPPAFSASDDFKQKLNNIQLVYKTDDQIKNDDSFKIGEHTLTPEEVAEKKAFEEQKRALEDRAERLRRMSFNINGNEGTDEMENVPAYIRKNMSIDNGLASADKFYSGYSVGYNEGKNDDAASIQTINTFLDGKKPD